MNDQIYKVCLCHSVYVQGTQLIGTLPDNFSTFGIQRRKNLDKIWINELRQTWDWSPNSRISCNNFRTYFVDRQLKFQIAKPPMIDREGANNSKTFLSRWRKRSTFKKNKIRNIKDNRKRVWRSDATPVFPKWRSHPRKQAKQRTCCSSKHGFFHKQLPIELKKHTSN